MQYFTRMQTKTLEKGPKRLYILSPNTPAKPPLRLSHKISLISSHVGLLGYRNVIDVILHFTDRLINHLLLKLTRLQTVLSVLTRPKR
jgi:hypothetical protein